ncbi:hypothetical protein NDU88_004037 [Pleurodeles waltl]|uniref:Uncharacterized protein n=1 Tax=Pleurodeles waltl TaxID=8319 RepID=A0AAV7WWJ1_PLEWA|nr:hypothetical protein NDU88_004037 [Pleurodeles waltl]
MKALMSASQYWRMKALMSSSECRCAGGTGPPPGALGLQGPVVSPQDWICCCSCPALRENKSAYERKSVPECRWDWDHLLGPWVCWEL